MDGVMKVKEPAACLLESTLVIPDELLLKILSFVSHPADRTSACLVSKRWMKLELTLRHKLCLDVISCSRFRSKGFYKGCIDTALESVLRKYSHVRDVKISNPIVPDEATITDKGLDAIGKWCTNLKRLKLIFSSSISAVGVASVAAGCGGSLEELELYRCPGVEILALTAIASHCFKLKNLSLKMCSGVDDDALVKLSRGSFCASLEDLNLELCESVGDTGVAAMAAACPKLTFLGVSRCNVTDAGVAAVADSCPLLHSVDLRTCLDVSDASMAALAARCPALEELDVRRCWKITPAGVLRVLAGCRQLSKLWVEEKMVSTAVRDAARLSRINMIISAASAPTLPAIGWY